MIELILIIIVALTAIILVNAIANAIDRHTKIFRWWEK